MLLLTIKLTGISLEAVRVQFASNAEKCAWQADVQARVRERHDDETRLRQADKKHARTLSDTMTRLG